MLRIFIPLLAVCAVLCASAFTPFPSLAAKPGGEAASTAPVSPKDFRFSAPIIPESSDASGATGVPGVTNGTAKQPAPSGNTAGINGTEKDTAPSGSPVHTNATVPESALAGSAGANATAQGGSGGAAAPAATSAALAPEGVLFRVALPPEVFLYSALPRKDGADISVSNADGRSLPFSMRQPDRREVRASSTVDKLYPLWGKPQSAPEDLFVSFSLDAQGRIVPRLSGGQNVNEAPKGQELKGYIIPLPDADMPISYMTFAWDKGADSTVQFTLQTGDDLKSWRTLVSRAALVRFDGPDGALESSQISLNGARADKYLRIIFDQGMAPARMYSVSVEQWSSVRMLQDYGPVSARLAPAQAATDKQPAVVAGLEYSLAVPNLAHIDVDPSDFLHGGLSLDSLQLYAPKPGQYASVKVFTREDGKSPWRYLGDYTFFAVVRGGELVQSKPLPLGGRHVAQIRFESTSEGRALPEDMLISVTYIPQELYFLTQGPAPYMLAWSGKRPGLRDDAGISVLMSQGGDIMPAILGSIHDSPPSKPQDPPYDWAKGNWLKFVLWGLLGLGVLLLGGMALKLAKSMKTD